MTKRDYYEVLSVSRDADSSTIKRSYRKLAIKYHPDRNQDDPEAEDKFKEAAEAYEVLSDQQKRATYDRFGHEGLKGSGFSGFNGFDDIFSHFGDIFGDIFGFGGGGAGGGRRRRGPRRGADLRFDLTIRFEEAVFGTEETIPITRWELCESCEGSGAEPGTHPETCTTCGGRGQVVHSQGLFMISTTCPRCQGTGEIISKICHECEGRGRVRVEKEVSVRIPAGVDNGTRIRLSGEGERGDRNTVPGDLYVFLRVEPHEFFERDDEDLHCEIPIGIVEATLGTKVDIPLLDGSTEKVKVPAGTQPHETLPPLRGKGVPRLRGRGRGNLYVHIKVIVPRKVNRKQRGLLEKFAELS